MILWSAAASSRNASRVGNTGPISRIGFFRWVRVCFGAAQDEFSVGKAGGCAGVAGWSMLVNFYQHSVIIAVQGDGNDMLSVSGGIAFAPVFGPRARPVPGSSGGQGQMQCLVVHPAQHQHRSEERRAGEELTVS